MRAKKKGAQTVIQIIFLFAVILFRPGLSSGQGCVPVIDTVAGIPNNPGFSGDGGPATTAPLNNPNKITVDKEGNLYIADGYHPDLGGNYRIRKVDTGGIITTVAGNGSGNYDCYVEDVTATNCRNAPHGVAVDSDGNIYNLCMETSVRRIDSDTRIITKVYARFIHLYT